MKKRGRRRKKKRAIERRKKDRRLRTMKRIIAVRRAVTPIGEHGIGFDPKNPSGAIRLWQRAPNGQTYKKTTDYVWFQSDPSVGIEWFTLSISFRRPYK